jgi:hypothetical protein
MLFPLVGDTRELCFLCLSSFALKRLLSDFRNLILRYRNLLEYENRSGRVFSKLINLIMAFYINIANVIIYDQSEQ